MALQGQQALTWPNAERVMKWVVKRCTLNGRPFDHVGRETPIGPDLQPPGGTVRIERIGGVINRDRTLDSPLIEIASFGDFLDDAQAMSMAIEGALADLVGEHVGEGPDRTCLDGYRMATGPMRPPWGRNAKRDVITWECWWRPVVLG